MLAHESYHATWVLSALERPGIGTTVLSMVDSSIIQMAPSIKCRHVAVIGAGAAGLVAARELRREGHSVVVFERQNQVGGGGNLDLHRSCRTRSVER